MCNTDLFGHNQYCSYNGTPKTMPEDGIKLLEERCGFMLESGQKEFCCDAQQVNTIEKNRALYNKLCTCISF